MHVTKNSIKTAMRAAINNGPRSIGVAEAYAAMDERRAIKCSFEWGQ